MTLRLNAFSGVRWTAFSAFGRAALQILQIAVLARILSPQEFGVVAIGGSFYFFLQLLSDAGIGSSIINRKEIDRLALSSIYFLNLIVSGILSLLFAICAEGIGLYYHSDVLSMMIYIMAVTLFVTAIGQPHRFLAHRRLDFSPVAQIDVGGAILGLVVTVLLAFLGMGPLAVSFGLLSSALFVTLFLWVRFRKNWQPSLHMSWSETKGVVAYGAYVTGNNIFGGLSSQVDILIGARFVGLGEVGGYGVQRDISVRVSNLVNQIVAQVGFPVMAKANGDIQLLRKIYLKALRSTASVNFPIYLCLALFSSDFTVLFLGAKWAPHSDVLTILCIWAIFRSVLHPISSLVFACGRGRLGFFWSLIVLLTVSPCVYFGSKWGSIGMAWALSSAYLLLIFPSWIFVVRRMTECSISDYLVQIGIPLLCGMAAALVSVGVILFLPEGFFRLLLGSMVFLSAYLFWSYLFNKSWLSSMYELFFKKRLFEK